MVHGGSAASGGDGKHQAGCADPASSEEQHTSAYGPFQKCPSINERFPGATGVILLQLIWNLYVLHKHSDIAWFTSTGARAITRHPLNMRNIGKVLEEIVQSMLENGWLMCVSNRPIMMATENSEVFTAVGAGSRTDSFYIALERAPQNKLIQACLKHKLQDAVILHKDTPEDVVNFLVVRHNDFHSGSPNTHIQACPWLKMCNQT